MESQHNQGVASDLQTGRVWVTSTAGTLSDNSDWRQYWVNEIFNHQPQPYVIYTGTQNAGMWDEALKEAGKYYSKVDLLPEKEQPQEEGYNYLKMITVTNKNEKSKSNN